MKRRRRARRNPSVSPWVWVGLGVVVVGVGGVVWYANSLGSTISNLQVAPSAGGPTTTPTTATGS